MSDLSDALEQLDRLHQFFADRGDADVYAELYRFVAALEADARTSSVFAELVEECVERLRAAQAQDEAIAREVVELRREIVLELPQLEDKPQDVASGPDVDPFPRQWSLARFDELAAGTSSIRFSLLARDIDDGSLATKLIRILESRLRRMGEDELFPNEPGAATPSSEFIRSVSRIKRRHQHFVRDWLLYTRTDGCASALRILGIARDVNPKPRALSTDLALFALLEEAWVEVAYPFRNLRANTFGERVEMANTPRDAELVAMIRTEARRAYEETRRRLLSMRSHRALVLRFAQWVQLYGRNELYDLAKNTPGKVEDVLTQQLARFLFERGLNPLTKANVGPSQPDLLDPTTRWSFYVEAKQYNEAGRSVVKKAVRQIADTLLPLRALPNGIREAFLVVFRVGGPRLVLPPEVPVDGVRIWPVLVDIAPSSEANSHQKHTPIVVSLEELLAHDEQ